MKKLATPISLLFYVLLSLVLFVVLTRYALGFGNSWNNGTSVAEQTIFIVLIILALMISIRQYISIKSRKSFKVIRIAMLSTLILSFIMSIAALPLRNSVRKQSVEDIYIQALVGFTYRGGLCAYGACQYDTYTLDDQRVISRQTPVLEKGKGKIATNKLDDKNYKQALEDISFIKPSAWIKNNNANCSSYVDGSDLMLMDYSGFALLPSEYNICEYMVPDNEMARINSLLLIMKVEI
jgi:hypothetical protein